MSNEPMNGTDFYPRWNLVVSLLSIGACPIDCDLVRLGASGSAS